MSLRFLARLSCFILLIALVCAFLPATGAQAQEGSKITLTARAGFDGYCKENRWIPVRVSVENTGADVQARIQASYPNRVSGQTAYGLDLPLPAASRKEFFIYLFPDNFLQKLTVSVMENGRALVKRDLNINCLGENNLLVGLLADTPAAYASLNDLEPLNGFARIVQLRPADLPDQSQGWEALDALVIAGADTGALSPEQRSALGAWLAGGGKLFVAGGVNWQPAAAGLADVLPLTPDSTRRVESLSELQSYFRESAPLTGETRLASGALHKNAQVLIAQDGLPLLVRRPIGFGEVYYFAADPGLQPLSNWEGMKTVYSHLLAVQIPRPRWTGWPWDENATGNALAALPELGLPSFLFVCGWLGFYLVVIGPANFIILRRLKRPELAWLTIPALVIVFTVIAYTSGFLYRGTRPTLNRLLVAQGWDTAPQARVNAVMGIYSPNRTRYSLEADAPFKFHPQGNDGINLQTGGSWLALQQGNSHFLPEARLEIGGMKSVALDGSLPALQITHDLTVTISSRVPALTGQVTNDSPLTLKEAFLVTPGSMTKLGDLAPGESRPVSISLQVDRDNPGLYKMDSLYSTYPGVYFPGQGENETSQRRNALLRAAVTPQQYYSVPSNWGIYLMGWVETPLLPAGVRGVNFKTVDTSLVIQMLTPAFQFEGNRWQLTSALFAWEATQPDVSPYYSYGISGSGYSLRFRPAAPLDFSSVKTLTVTLDCTSRPEKVTLALWDYENSGWSQVDFSDWGQIDIPEPERFVGPGGEIRLNLQADQDDWNEVRESSVNLVVEP